MESKKCKNCEEEKPLSEFYKNNKTTYKPNCKLCCLLKSKNDIKRKERQKEYYLENKEIINEKNKAYYLENKDYFNDKNKNYYSENKEKFVEYHQDNREEILKRQKEYRDNNPDKIRRIKKEYRDNNPDKIKEYRDKYYLENKENILKKNREWNKNNSYIVAWRTVLKSQLRRMGKSKEGRTIELLGYSALELKEHIKSLFTEGMTWDNYGEWEIDHKLPVSSFDKDTLPSIVNALDNLQPLWQSENRSKYNKY
jgi:hypothetical protein